ncbi:hypothetical protein [Shewanella psychropiezotolerans]|nr:hypothetical protein [Shewanella psychropiezotolerans]
MITFIVSFVVYILLNVSVSVYTALLSEHTSSSEQGRIISLSGQAYSLTWFLASLFIGVPRANDFLLLICITFLFLSLLFIRKLQ